MELSGAGLAIVCVLAGLLVVVFLIASAIRIAPQHQRIVMFRLGQYNGTYGPGLVIGMPFGIDRSIRVDLRERTHKVEEETFITQDERRIALTLACDYKVVDAAKSILAVENLEAALNEAVRSTLKSFIGRHVLFEVLHEHERAAVELRERLNEGVRLWGIEFTRVELGAVRST